MQRSGAFQLRAATEVGSVGAHRGDLPQLSGAPEARACGSRAGFVGLWMALLVLTLFPGEPMGAYAADAVQPSGEPLRGSVFDERWSAAFGTYVWAASLSGTAGGGGLPASSVDASFADIFDNLDFAFMALGEIRYGRIGISTDLMFTRLAAEGSGPAGFVDADFSNDLTVATLMGQYRAIERDRSSLDLMAGARLWNVSADLTLTGPAGGTASAGFDETWVDPMIGVKGRLQGSSPWYGTAWALAGGFGVSSDFTWDVLGAVGYEVTDWLSLVAGYRAYGVDYQDDGFVFDVIQHGPIVSGVVRF